MTPADEYFASLHAFSLKRGGKKICEVQAIPGKQLEAMKERGRGKKNVHGFS